MAGPLQRAARRIVPRALEAFVSPRTRNARRWLAEGRRRLGGEPHRVHYFHQVDDPYSQLAAQVLAPLSRRYDIELVPHLVGPPPDDAAPERKLLEAFSRADAADVAPGFGLDFPVCDAPRDADRACAAGILAAAIDTGDFASVAGDVGRALWAGDRAALDAIAAAKPPAADAATADALAAGDALRRERGHYLGATFQYGGEWYWGVDRLSHLERRLQSLGLQQDGSDLIAPRPDFTAEGPVAAEGRRVSLEFFASLRSPYTYISMERTFALARRLPVELVLRPVLPMVMRGLPVPRAKQLYIVADTKREAEDAGVPFGRLCDPVGRPVERIYSLFPWAREQGRAAELLLSFARAAFAEGIDTGEDAGLRRVVERAGLSWNGAQRDLDGDAWRPEIESNRETMFAAGLWGVPSFRVLGRDGEADFATWGQDRLWLVEQRIRQRLAGAAPQP